jgi:hypothetical protein
MASVAVRADRTPLKGELLMSTTPCAPAALTAVKADSTPSGPSTIAISS